MWTHIREDIAALRRYDPVLGAQLDVLVTPGLFALLLHRWAHRRWNRGARWSARLVSQVNRWLTGIEIHPAALLGRRIVFGPGVGVVIGETAVVGDDVVIGNDVTLGGTGKAGGKRHPTIGCHVVIGAGAKVLGAITVGDHAWITDGTVVVAPVPPGATAIGIPARLIPDSAWIRVRSDQATPMDPYARVMLLLQTTLQNLESQLAELEDAAQAQNTLVAGPVLRERDTVTID